MKIEPRHDYKRPLYVAGVTAVLGATMLFGKACSSEKTVPTVPKETETQSTATSESVIGPITAGILKIG